MLNYIALSKNSTYFKQTENLYLNAFPEEERPPFDFTLRFKDNVMYAIEDDGTYVGLIDLSHNEDIVYIFFLAVDPIHRNKGYGARILKDITNKYADKRIYLSIEAVDPSAENYAQRLSRLGFYERNGFHPTGERFIEYGVEYDLLTYNHVKVTSKDHFRLMTHILGEKLGRLYYPQAF